MVIYVFLFLLGWEWWRVYYQVNLILLTFVEIKVSLTGLSKFKEGVSKIKELLSLQKGINLHLQEIKMDLTRGNEKAIGVFISGSDNKQLGWIPRETISEVQRMGRMEDLKISLITFKEKEISLHFSKIDCVKNLLSWVVIRQLPWFFILVVCKTLAQTVRTFFNSGVNDNNSCYAMWYWLCSPVY